MARVLLLEPYGSDSHRTWVEGVSASSHHDVRSVVMAAETWRWRLRAGAIELAELALASVADGWQPDVLLVSSMVNAAALRGQLARTIGAVPMVLYMHESQFAFPDHDVTGAPRESSEEFAAVNTASMAAADQIVFNSEHHLSEALDGFKRLFVGRSSAAPDLSDRLHVVPVGVPLEPLRRRERVVGERPLVLWNHRWDHDKDPQRFFRALESVDDLDWGLAVVGRNERADPQEFGFARDRFADRIEVWGFLDRSDYVDLLGRADIAVSTARHEYFGVAMVEAMAAGAIPVLPNRLSYPELVPSEWHADVLYDNGSLSTRLRFVLDDVVYARDRIAGLAEAVCAHFDVDVVTPRLDDVLSSVLSCR
ncbi:MAG: tRNA-queuosine alpha-mannosyltransferase domain-containing protein [Acidimicrobiales bacterium]